MRESLRIVHTESSLGWGGQEIRVFGELLAMRARGHSVWLAAQPQAKIWSKAREAGLPLFPISEKSASFPLSIFRLAQFFRREQVEVVHTHSSKDAWLGGIAARLAAVPCSVRARHIEVDYPCRWRSRIVFQYLPDAVLTTSGKIGSRLCAEVGVDAEKISCVATGVDLARFSPDVAGTLRAQLGLAADVPLVGMVSVIRSWKGHDYFLRAAEAVHRDHPQAHFIIAGDGPGVAKLLVKISENQMEGFVHYIGHCDEVPQLLADLDILVLPSTAHEGIPQIILQARCMGVAVVASRVGGIPEVVEDGVTGLLVEPADVPSLASAITQVLEDQPRRQSMGHAALRERESFGIDAMCERTEAVYRGILEGRK